MNFQQALLKAMEPLLDLPEGRLKLVALKGGVVLNGTHTEGMIIRFKKAPSIAAYFI